MQQYDIIVVGAGLVGTSFIQALKGQGCSIAVLETHLPTVATKPEPQDDRPISLTYGSQIILNAMGLWPTLQSVASPIQQVHVSEQGQFGSLTFTAEQQKVPALGYVVPFAALRQALYQSAAAVGGVDIIPINALQALRNEQSGIVAVIDTARGQRELQGQLLVAADGSRSTCRQLLHWQTRHETTNATALMATLQLAEPHKGEAYQRFTPHGVLALLPLYEQTAYRLVWTVPSDQVKAITAWSEQQWNAHLAQAFRRKLSNILSVTPGGQFPLATIVAEQPAREHIVLLGNAAHTLYPLAAQGFNLALRDVAALSEVLVEALATKQALGDLGVLQKYTNWRAQDQRYTEQLTRGVTQWFGLHLPLAGKLRALGLLSTDLLPPGKQRLAKRLMGLAGRLPRLARGLSLTEWRQHVA